VFARLSLFVLVGVVCAALATKSVGPLVVAGLVLWGLMRWTNALERRL
jgi:hypothetical protein